MRMAVLSSVKDGMATVVYGTKGREASNPMPILAVDGNLSLKPGDRVIVAPLEGRKDGIVLGRYWNRNHAQELEG